MMFDRVIAVADWRVQACYQLRLASLHASWQGVSWKSWEQHWLKGKNAGKTLCFGLLKAMVSGEDFSLKPIHWVLEESNLVHWAFKRSLYGGPMSLVAWDKVLDFANSRATEDFAKSITAGEFDSKVSWSVATWSWSRGCMLFYLGPEVQGLGFPSLELATKHSEPVAVLICCCKSAGFRPAVHIHMLESKFIASMSAISALELPFQLTQFHWIPMAMVVSQAHLA